MSGIHKNLGLLLTFVQVMHKKGNLNYNVMGIHKKLELVKHLLYTALGATLLILLIVLTS